jgi:hypothetical protein
MSTPITVNYRDHVISYDLDSNEWTCDAFAHNRGSPSLLLAQGRIDKLLDPPAGKPKFEKVSAWYNDHWKGWINFTITSKTEDGCWVTKGKDREKLRSHNMGRLYTDTPANVALIEEIKRLDEERGALGAKINDATEKLEVVKL